MNNAMFFKKDKPLSPEAVADVLSEIAYPGTDKDLISLGYVRDLQVSGSKIRLELAVPGLSETHKEELVTYIKDALRKLKGVEFVHISPVAEAKPAANHGHSHTQAKPNPNQAQGRISLPRIRNVIAVASGKGGVGKSTVAVSLSLALAQEGKRVGLLDADIYGPSLPTMLGVNSRPAQTEGGKIFPIIKDNLKLMSMGFMIPEGQPVVWRGPMVHGALTQFLTQVDWGDLDYLIVDMPPGTGDAQLTMSQTAPLSGAIIVTTPQEISLIDARKGLKMFESVQVPILGIVENMSGFTTPDGKSYSIFKTGGGKKLAEESGTPLLGVIPLDPLIAEGGDSGKSVVLAHPESPAAQIYRKMAKTLIGDDKGSRKSDFQPLSLQWQ